MSLNIFSIIRNAHTLYEGDGDFSADPLAMAMIDAMAMGGVPPGAQAGEYAPGGCWGERRRAARVAEGLPVAGAYIVAKLAF